MGWTTNPEGTEHLSREFGTDTQKLISLIWGLGGGWESNETRAGEKVTSE